MLFKKLRSITESKSTKGILYMLAAVALIGVMNASAKVTTNDHNPIEIIFYRSVIGLVIIFIWLSFHKNIHRLKTEKPLLHISRALVGTTGMFFMYWAYALLPMTDVSALLLTSSLFVGILSGPVLRENVGPWRWGAIIIGLIGAVIVANPTGELFNAKGVIAALLAALSGACVSIFLRSMGKTEEPITTTFYVALTGVGLTSLYMIFYGHRPTENSIIPLLILSLAGTLSLIFKARAYQLSEASLLSPCHYTSVLWALLFGFIIFSDVPTPMVLLGSFIIILSNAIIVWREHILKHQKSDVQKLDDIP